MKKKIALFLSVLSVVMMLGACGAADPTTVDYNGVTYDQLYEESLSLGTALAGASEEDVTNEMLYLQQSGSEEYTLLIDLCDKWLAAMEVSGNFVDVAENGFTITKSGEFVTITTKGYGHGVGMSQYGAQGMAKAGYKYDEILKHYYQGIEISKMSV